MPKSKNPLRYVVKIHSARLRKARWNLNVEVDELRRHAEMVSIGNSQLVDFIDELRERTDVNERGLQLKQRIKLITEQESSMLNRNNLARLREEFFNLTYLDDLIMVVMDNTKDFQKLCAETFMFNGRRMKFLIATTGGVKTSTMMFVTEDLYDELWRRLNNGRNESLKMIPAKLEAYMALACSSSVAVSDPTHVLVVQDCVTHFKDDIIHIKDADDGSDEPILTFEDNVDCELIESDGYGLISPELCKKWGIEIGEGGYVSGMNCRCAFVKGMLFTFPFQRFAHEIAHETIVKDVWGQEHDIDTVDLILTTSQLKLWQAYSSWDDYWSNCQKNHYTFRISKVCARHIEKERTTNYQFIQPYNWTDEQVDGFIEPTIKAIKDMSTGDWMKTVLYVRGSGLTAENVAESHNDWTKALMTCPQIMDDPFVKSKVKQMIKRRIEDAAIGVIDVHGNYCIISGDPFSLCQSIFGLEVTGLLKAGECYHRYWADQQASEVTIFRAPMSCANNIRKLKVADSDMMRDWYSYMRTCLILNSWDNTCAALNGADRHTCLLGGKPSVKITL